jgi:hypothetical protein
VPFIRYEAVRNKASSALRHQRIGDEDVPNIAIRNDFGLGDLDHGDARRTRFELASGDRWNLVGLDVRPQLYSTLPRDTSHTLIVAGANSGELSARLTSPIIGMTMLLG